KARARQRPEGVGASPSPQSGPRRNAVAPLRLRRRRLPQPTVQLAQLPLIDGARRLGQQTLCALRFRERDHIANRIGTGHHRDDAVEPERDPAMRRRAVLKRIKQEAELRARFLGAQLERAEDLALYFLTV